MNNRTVKLLLLLALTCVKAQGQTVVYTYNAQGCCSSRVLKGITPKAKKVEKQTIDAKLLQVSLSPSPTFQDQLSISVTGLLSGYSLSYVMANVSGQVVLNGTVENGLTTLPTTTLPKGVYIIKFNGEGFEESYKLLKN